MKCSTIETVLGFLTTGVLVVAVSLFILFVRDVRRSMKGGN